MGVVAGLMGMAVIVRVFAQSQAMVPVIVTAAITVGVVLVLPYAALIHRSIVIDDGTLNFFSPMHRTTIAAGDVGLMVGGSSGPDPQLDIFDVHGNRVWRFHLAYWPPDLKRTLQSAGPTGRMTEEAIEAYFQKAGIAYGAAKEGEGENKR